MDIVLAGIAFLILYQTFFDGAVGGYRDYLDKSQTAQINGIFVLFVFLRHFSQYITYGSADTIFAFINSHIGQLIVVPFLFYSGYGIGISIQKKGMEYVKGIPFRRVLRVWCHFVIAVLLFLAVNIVMHRKYDFVEIILAFLGWTSIGNSNWYVFIMLFLYFSTYMAYIVCKKPGKSVLLVAVMCMGYYIILRNFKEGYWYDTIFLYPIGLLYAQNELKIRDAVQNCGKCYWSALAGCTGLVLVLYYATIDLEHGATMLYWMLSCSFMAVILLLTMKVQFNNKVLELLGKYTFEIYILQRIPMIILQEIVTNKYIYLLSCFLVTMALAVVFRKLEDKIDRTIYCK